MIQWSIMGSASQIQDKHHLLVDFITLQMSGAVFKWIEKEVYSQSIFVVIG